MTTEIESKQEEHIFIKDIQNMQEGTPIKSTYLVKTAQSATASTGTYWNLGLADKSGQINSMLWNNVMVMNNITEVKTGSYVEIEATIGKYKDKAQFNFSKFRILAESEIEELNLSYYIPCSPIPIKELLKEKKSLIKKHITYKPWKLFLEYVFADERLARFDEAPGATFHHHAYKYGLLEHSLWVCKNCMVIADLYPNKIDKQTLFVAALLHDIGKIEELGSFPATEFTNEGALLGHTIIGLTMLEPYFEKAGIEKHLEVHLKHLLISHHGKLEFGAPVTPRSPEAQILHHADNIDSYVNKCINLELNDNDLVWGAGNPKDRLCKVKGIPE